MFQSFWGLKRCILLQGLKAGKASDGKTIDQVFLLFLLLRLLLGFSVVCAPLFLLFSLPLSFFRPSWICVGGEEKRQRIASVLKSPNSKTS